MVAEEDNSRVPPPPSSASTPPPPPPQPQQQEIQGPVRPPAPTCTSSTIAAAAGGGTRQRFYVELKPGETTIVSWKKLLKSSAPVGSSAPAVAVGPSGETAIPGLKHGIGSAAQNVDDVLKDAPPPNRYSAVIEKIERLYVGKHSSDEEELDDVPDEDEYDTEDSFIDDTELDEYFQVDKLETKHSGYFVNRGKLEQIEPMPSPDVAPRKRKRKDSTEGQSDGQNITKELPNYGNVRMKAAARNAPLVGRKMSNSSEVPTIDDYYLEGKAKSTVNPPATYKKKAADASYINFENSSAKLLNKDAFPVPLETKDVHKQKVAASTTKEHVHKSRTASESFSDVYQAPKEKNASSQLGFQAKKSSTDENDRRKERLDLNFSGSVLAMQAVHPSSTRLKEVAARPKGTTLERAIRDLERVVAECRPPDVDAVEADNSSQSVKRRLPQEVKQKLAKVARLSASQGKISEEAILDRLMGILGHLVQRKTLKRNMKEMIELGLSAKQQRADRFQQIKKEVNEMIKARVSLLKSQVAENQDGSADDFQEAPTNNDRRALLGKYSMDRALEDKISELYDMHVEVAYVALKIFPSRFQLAELWPSGYMDNLGIKDAIYRSKERKRSLLRRDKAREEERMKRKRLAAAMRLEEDSQISAVRTAQQRPSDSGNQVSASPERHISSQTLALSNRKESSSTVIDYGSYQSTKHYDRAKTGSTSFATDERILKKKIKRRPESEYGETQGHIPKPPAHDGREKSKPHKQSDGNILSDQLKSGFQLSFSNKPN